MSLYDEAKKQLEAEKNKKQDEAKHFSFNEKLKGFKRYIEIQLVEAIKKGSHYVKLDVLSVYHFNLWVIGEKGKSKIGDAIYFPSCRWRPDHNETEKIRLVENICESNGIEILHYFLGDKQCTFDGIGYRCEAGLLVKKSVSFSIEVKV